MSVSELKQNFENDLRKKLSQKSTAKESETTTLIKIFKFFDLDNSGSLYRNEFIKALNKLGIVFPLYEDANFIFELYDQDNKGKIDYREFSDTVLKNREIPIAQHKKNPNYMKFQADQNWIVKQTIQKLKNQLKLTGGICGGTAVGGISYIYLGLYLKDYDKNQEIFNKNKMFVTFENLLDVLKKMNLMVSITNNDLFEFFQYFDRTNDNFVEIEQLILGLRGKLNEFREELAVKAFQKIAQLSKKTQQINLDDIQKFCDWNELPEIKINKDQETASKNLLNFNHMYSLYRNLQQGRLNMNDFIDYLAFYGAVVDDDKDFQNYVEGVFKLKEDMYYMKKKKPMQIQRYSQSTNAQQSINQSPSIQESEISFNRQFELIINRIKQKLQVKGPKAFISLRKRFKLLDLDADGLLSYFEFLRGIRDQRIDITDSECEQIFSIFDENQEGQLNYYEFMKYLQGNLNQLRMKLIQQVFSKIDRDQDGIITIQEIKQAYSARNHPDVKVGKVNDEDSVNMLLESLLLNKQISQNQNMDEISFNDFLQFYHTYSACINDDKLFETIMIGTYQLTQENFLQQQYAGLGKKASNFQPQQRESYQSNSRNFTSNQVAPFGTDNEPTNYSTHLRPQTGKSYLSYQNEYIQCYKPIHQLEEQKHNNLQGDQIMEKIRDKLKQRGIRSYQSLQRLFKMCDYENTNQLCYQEFFQTLKDFRIDLKENEIKKIFMLFDSNQSQTINYDDFLKNLRQNMHPNRQNLVLQVFEKLNPNQNLYISLDDIKDSYNPSRHPDVLSRKRDQEEILGEFLDSFESHLATMKNDDNLRDQRVFLDEFLEYYANVSACIDSEEYFSTIIRNCWNLNSQQIGKVWTEDLKYPKKLHQKFY